LAPWVLTVVGEGQEAIADLPATQVQVTVTFVLFHPLLLGSGLATPVIVGGVVSMFKVTLALAVFPATSVTVPLMT